MTAPPDSHSDASGARASNGVGCETRLWAREWLFRHALPLWCANGVDWQYGGFHDKLDQHGAPVGNLKRLRVQARQIYVYAEAGKLGWGGPWRAVVDHGISYLNQFLRDDGFYRASLGVQGEIIEDAPDLYDQAFVLLALASVSGIDEAMTIASRRAAERLIATLRLNAPHPQGGFRELDASRQILRADPQMHLLEALLKWVSVVGVDAVFAPQALKLVELVTTRMIDPDSKSVGEYFQDDWRLAGDGLGATRSPGHQFEWSVLLAIADRLLGTSTSSIGVSLVAFGESLGVHAGHVLLAVDNGGRPLDYTVRLWAQAERLRALLLLGDRLWPDDAARVAATQRESLARLSEFLLAEPEGSWRDRASFPGVWLDEPAPASSLYHVFNALVSVFKADGVSSGQIS